MAVLRWFVTTTTALAEHTAAAVVFAVGVSTFINQNTSFFTQDPADQALVACMHCIALAFSLSTPYKVFMPVLNHVTVT
jgi:hypothetical protein